MKSPKKEPYRLGDWTRAGEHYPHALTVVAEEYDVDPALGIEFIERYFEALHFDTEQERITRRLKGEEEPCGATEEHGPHNSRSVGVCFGAGLSREVPEGGIDPSSTTYPDGSTRPCGAQYADHRIWWPVAWCKRPVGHGGHAHPDDGPGHGQRLWEMDK